MKRKHNDVYHKIKLKIKNHGVDLDDSLFVDLRKELEVDILSAFGDFLQNSCNNTATVKQKRRKSQNSLRRKSHVNSNVDSLDGMVIDSKRKKRKSIGGYIKIETIFENELLANAFEKHMKDIYCEEMLYSYMECHKFPQTSSVIQEATDIGNKYLGLLPKSIPISGVSPIDAKSCCNKITDGNVNPGIFDPIENSLKAELLFHWRGFMLIWKKNRKGRRNENPTLEIILQSPEEYNLFSCYLETELDESKYLLKLYRDIYHLRNMHHTSNVEKMTFSHLSKRHELIIGFLDFDIRTNLLECFEEASLDKLSQTLFKSGIIDSLEEKIPGFTKRKTKASFLKKVDSFETVLNIDIQYTEFNDVVDNSILRNHFKKHLESVYALENLDFYLRTLKFKKNYQTSNAEGMRNAAKNIGRSFLGYDGHDLILGIEPVALEIIHKELDKPDFGIGIFDNLLNEQKRILETMYIDFAGAKFEYLLTEESSMNENFVKRKELMFLLNVGTPIWNTILRKNFFLVVYKRYQTMFLCDISGDDRIFYIEDINEDEEQCDENIIHDFYMDDNQLYIAYYNRVNVVDYHKIQGEVVYSTIYTFILPEGKKPVLIVNRKNVAILYNDYPHTKGYIWKKNQPETCKEFSNRTKFGGLNRGLTHMLSDSYFILGSSFKAELWDIDNEKLLYTFEKPGQLFRFLEVTIKGNVCYFRSPGTYIMLIVSLTKT
eukprot:TRINITY_DN8229_c0_g1_i2.p1 TRINITY_DN8229_c0_g1~~TRINITY_DN8229_c0_g1_i2.p1  ORF type:complete len:796 (-),score=141.85 TRINITY_DN8229_c0_g1_i2:460-2607(-)